MIPNIAHFVFGLREQMEPFHPLYYAAIESCREVLEPEQIYFHYRHLPYGAYWDRVRPSLTLHQVELPGEVLGADYSANLVPPAYRYAHHADFVRLDALIEHGGVYADIDTVFLRPFPTLLFEARFVIGTEPPVRDEHTGAIRPSLCNALMMSEPGSAFARAWRAQMAEAMDGSWSNHSGFLSERLSREMPDQVTVVPQTLFFPFGPDPADLQGLLETTGPIPSEALSVHLWAHLWWDRDRLDMSRAHSGWCTPAALGHAPTTIARIVRPYLPKAGANPAPLPRWRYLSLDERSGYGVAADRCRDALEASGLEADWIPFVPGPSWGLGYEPAFPIAGPNWSDDTSTMGDVVVAHLVPEFFPLVRRALPESFLVGHTVWETDRLPAHWPVCLEKADLIVVPSTFAQEVATSGGVTRPVAVVPHVAPDTSSRSDERWLGLDPDQVVFYTIAEWTERKAVSHTVEAYLRAFRSSDPVVLVIKTSHRDLRHRGLPATRLGPGTTAFAVARLLAAHRNPPAVRLVTRVLTEAEVSGLHRRGDCFVSLCRSEGWGLGAFDAATYGNPVVTTGYGGHLDYLNESPFLVDFDLVSVSDPGNASYTPDQRWAEPDLDHAVEICRAIAADLPSARTSTEPLAERIRASYHPLTVARSFRSAVQHYREGGSAT